MKKLLITFALISGNILAVPIAQSGSLIASPNTHLINGSFSGFVQGGLSPYQFQITQVQNVTVNSFDPATGQFNAAVTGTPAGLQYIVTDANRDSSAPAILFLRAGPNLEEKG